MKAVERGIPIEGLQWCMVRIKGRNGTGRSVYGSIAGMVRTADKT